MKIEERFEELDKIVKKLELGESTLEESFELYKEGMDMIKECNKEIDKVEKQLVILQSDTEENEEQKKINQN